MKINFSEDKPFVVKNSIGILLFIAATGFLFLISSFYMENGLIFTLGGSAAVLFGILGSVYRKKIIGIDRDGIYTFGELITDWQHFTRAHFEERENVQNYDTYFVLLIEYSKQDSMGYFQSVIQLTSTQNKSEEAVVAAIYFFYNNYKSKNTPVKMKQEEISEK